MNVTERAREILGKKSKASPRREVPLGEVSVPPTRNGFLEWIYSTGIVEAGEFPAHCSDKLLFSRFLEILLPENTFHPKTRGLSELLPGLEENLFREFPGGFVAKPVDGMNSDGKEIYLSEEQFIRDFRSSPAVFLKGDDTVSRLTGLRSSGEKFLVQEKIGHRESEFRLHTLEGKVVKGATYTRWDQEWDGEKFIQAEKALQKFLDELPSWFVAGQAWSVDLILEKDFRMVEANSNRGSLRHWSGDLSIPDTLQAYVLHLERFYGARFLGESGELFRRGEANQAAFGRKFGPEAVERHKILRNSLKSKR